MKEKISGHGVFVEQGRFGDVGCEGRYTCFGAYAEPVCVHGNREEEGKLSELYGKKG